MIEYDDIIKDSPFLVNHLITLKKTHDFYINKHIKRETEILPSQYYMLLFLYYEMGKNKYRHLPISYRMNYLVHYNHD
jgi:hypothetical protein